MKKYTYTEKKDTRSGFGAGLAELGRTNPNVVALCADLIGSLKMNTFIDENPDRFFQVGIAEANMMGIAAGLTIGGKIPFTGTFANFSTGRVYDQIRQSIAYSGKNVKICASHAGVTLGEDGATHQILEDIGLMKMLPGMVVINPCDYNQTKAATIAIADYYGPVYLRFGRPSVPVFTDENQIFEIGKAINLIEGNDVTIAAVVAAVICPCALNVNTGIALADPTEPAVTVSSIFTVRVFPLPTVVNPVPPAMSKVSLSKSMLNAPPESP